LQGYGVGTQHGNGLRRQGRWAIRAVGATLLAFAVSTRAPVFAADIAYGEYLAAECVGCHHPAARTDTIPQLGLLSYADLVGALRAYRDGSRPDPTMQSVARSLGDAEIEALAAYFSGGS
jgi:cytochrome c553